MVEGRYVPLHKMAAGQTTSPRMHGSDRCQCLSPLITAGAQVWERESTKEWTHTRKEASDVAQTELGVGITVIFATTIGRRQVRSNLMEPMFAFGELI